MTQSRDGLIVEIDVRDLDIGWQTVGDVYKRQMQRTAQVSSIAISNPRT